MFTVEFEELDIESEFWICYVNPNLDDRINHPKKYRHAGRFDGRFSSANDLPFIRFYGQWEDENNDKRILDIGLPYMDERRSLTTGMYIIAKSRREIINKLFKAYYNSRNDNHMHFDTVKKYYFYFSNEKPEWLI